MKVCVLIFCTPREARFLPHVRSSSSPSSSSASLMALPVSAMSLHYLWPTELCFFSAFNSSWPEQDHDFSIFVVASSTSSSPDMYFHPPSRHVTCLSHSTWDLIHISSSTHHLPTYTCPASCVDTTSYTCCSNRKPKNHLGILIPHPQLSVQPPALLISPLKGSGTSSSPASLPTPTALVSLSDQVGSIHEASKKRRWERQLRSQAPGSAGGQLSPASQCLHSSVSPAVQRE